MRGFAGDETHAKDGCKLSCKGVHSQSRRRQSAAWHAEDAFHHDITVLLRSPEAVSRLQVFNNEDHRLNLYGTDIEVDYRGLEVNAASVLDLLTGRHAAVVPPTKRLRSDASSNVLVSGSGPGRAGERRCDWGSGSRSVTSAAPAAQQHQMSGASTRVTAATLSEHLHTPAALEQT